MRKWLIYAIWSCEALGLLQIDIAPSTNLACVRYLLRYIAKGALGRGAMTELNSAEFLANFVILCFDRQYPEQNTFARWKSEYWCLLRSMSGREIDKTGRRQSLQPVALPAQNIWRPIPQFYTALSHLIFNLPRQKARINAIPPDTSELKWKCVSIVIFILRSKKYHRVVAVLFRVW